MTIIASLPTPSLNHYYFSLDHYSLKVRKSSQLATSNKTSTLPNTIIGTGDGGTPGGSWDLTPKPDKGEVERGRTDYNNCVK